MNSALVMLHGRVGCHPLLVYWNILASDTLLFAALTLRSAARTLHLSATAFSASNRGALAPHHRREEVWVGTTTTLATSGRAWLARATGAGPRRANATGSGSAEV